MLSIYGDKEYTNQLILGSILGDGHVEMARGNNLYPNIGFTQSTKNDLENDYLKLKHTLISKYYRTNPIRRGHNNTDRFTISSREVDLTKEMIELTRYSDNSRKFPDIKYITPIVLLYWYIDDGSLTLGKQKRPNGRRPSIYRIVSLHLQSYKDEDILKVMNDINEKFNLNFKPKREKGKITAITIRPLKEIMKFLDLMNPLLNEIPEKQHYKFCIGYYPTRTINESTYEKYNKCNFHETAFCLCRNRNLTECIDINSSTTIPKGSTVS